MDWQLFNNNFKNYKYVSYKNSAEIYAGFRYAQIFKGQNV